MKKGELVFLHVVKQFFNQMNGIWNTGKKEKENEFLARRHDYKENGKHAVESLAENTH